MEVNINDEPDLGSGILMEEDGGLSEIMSYRKNKSSMNNTSRSGDTNFDNNTGRSFGGFTETGRSSMVGGGPDDGTIDIVVNLTNRNQFLEQEVINLGEDIERLEMEKKLLQQHVERLTGGTGGAKKEQPTIVNFVTDDGVKVEGAKKEQPTIVVLPGQTNTDGDGDGVKVEGAKKEQPTIVVLPGQTMDGDGDGDGDSDVGGTVAAVASAPAASANVEDPYAAFLYGTGNVSK